MCPVRGRDVRTVIELQMLTPDEWPLWRELRLRALEDAPSAFGSRIEDWHDADEARWRQRLSLPGSCNLVARLDGRPVGMVSGVPAEETDAAELVSLWVAPDARGRGVGDALLTAVAQWARERGARELRLDVAVGNTSAIALYVRHGFVDLGPSRQVGERILWFGTAENRDRGCLRDTASLGAGDGRIAPRLEPEPVPADTKTGASRYDMRQFELDDSEART